MAIFSFRLTRILPRPSARRPIPRPYRNAVLATPTLINQQVLQPYIKRCTNKIEPYQFNFYIIPMQIDSLCHIL